MNRHRGKRGSITSRCLAGLVLLSYLAAVIGFPLPTAAAPKPEPVEPPTCGCGAVANCCCTRAAGASGTHACCARPSHSAAGQLTSVSVSYSGKLSVSSQACPCQGTLWVIHGTLAPPPPVHWTPPQQIVEGLTYPAAAAHVLVLMPPDPPPRVST